MKRSRIVAALGTAALLLLPVACGGDDGANTRSAGSVVLIGPPPPGGGGSMSALGSGCTTNGATTKKAAYTIEIALDEYSVTPPAAVNAGVNRVVVKNFGSDPHEIVITQADSAAELTLVGGFVDLAKLPGKAYRVQKFASNTICEGTFEFPAGKYVAFSNLPAGNSSDYALGMVATFVVS